MKHLGIVATTSEGAALCFRVFCQPVLNSARLLARAAFDVASGHRALPTWCGGPVVDC